MRFLHRFRGTRHRSRQAFGERARLARTMPGETGALCALHLGVLVN